MMSEKIRLVLAKRDISKAELAKRINISASNMYNKMARDNFSEKELQQIAEALDCELEINFVLKDTGEKF